MAWIPIPANRGFLRHQSEHLSSPQGKLTLWSCVQSSCSQNPSGPPSNCHIPRSPWTQTHILTHPQESPYHSAPCVAPPEPAIEPALSLGDNGKVRWDAQASILRTLPSSLSVWAVLEPSHRTRLSRSRNPGGLDHLTTPSMGKPPWPSEGPHFLMGPAWTQSPT